MKSNLSICSLMDHFYDQVAFNFYIRQDAWVKVPYCFAYGYPIFLAPFVGKTILYSLNLLACLRKINWTCSWALNNMGLILRAFTCSQIPPLSPAKSFIVSSWSTAFKKTPRWLNSGLVAEGRGSGSSPDVRGMPEGILSRLWVLEAPTHAWEWA